MDFLMGILSFVLVLIPLVIIHEFGHFIAAKLVGITVLEFGIGFPPRAAVLFKRGETIYTLNWLPIGGFVRPYGEDFVRPKTPDELTEDRTEIEERGIQNPKSVNEAKPGERILFMAAGPLINLLAALLLFIFVALVGQPFQRADVTVYDVQPDSAAATAGIEQGDIIRTVDGQKVESAEDFNNLIDRNANSLVTLTIQRDQDTVDVPLMVSGPKVGNEERVYITQVEDDMPAKAAGFQERDVILAVDDIQINSTDQLIEYTQAHEGQEMIVTVLRGKDTLELPVTPREDKQGTVRIGIGIGQAKPARIGLTAINENIDTYTKALPPGEAVQVGVEEFVDMHKALATFVVDLIQGDLDLSLARPVSPIGIGQIGGPILEQSLDERAAYPIVMFAGWLSIALAITNLLPIPGLDGGRILFVLIEIIRGKPLEPEREGAIHFIGLLLLLGIIAITLINDIINPIDVGNLGR